MNEETKQHWLKIGTVALITFLVSYFAFYLAMKHNLRKLNDPYYQAQRMEKMIEKQAHDYFNDKGMNNPFEAKMRPMMVNLVKEVNEYKVIIDLSRFDGSEDTVDVLVNDNELTVKGEIDKKNRGTERIINFTQTYYLDEKIDKDKITREKKGNKYIVTIPFKSNEIEVDD